MGLQADSLSLLVDGVSVNSSVPHNITSNVSVSGLVPHTAYSFSASSSSSGGVVTSSSVVVTTLQAAPEVMTAPLVSVINATAVNVAWSPPVVPNGVVARYILARNGTTVCCAGESLSFVDAGLSPYTVYSYTVQAGTGDAGALVSDTSSAASVRTAGAPPSQLAAPTCTQTTSSNITVEWDAPVAANGVVRAYVVYVNGTRQWQQSDNDLLSPRRHVVTGLAAFTPYSFAVVAASDFGTSPLSEAVVCRTDIGVPAELASPTLSLFASNVSTGVNVTWAASSDAFPVEGYDLAVTLAGNTTPFVVRTHLLFFTPLSIYFISQLL